MCCPRPSELFVETLLTITHASWVLGWFCFGHLISMPIFNCREGWNGCNFVEPFGIGFALISSILYFFILKHVANFVYKKELPGGERLTADLASSVQNMVNQALKQDSSSGKKTRK